MTPRHFLDIDDYDIDTLRLILDCANTLKKTFKTPAASRPKLAKAQVLAMLFEKTSTRTRVSFDVAMRQLGGETIVLNHSDMQLGRGETIADTARVLSRYVDAIMMRAASHETLLELAQSRHRPRHQRPVGPVSSLPDPRRHHDLGGEEGAGRAAARGLGRRRQQRGGLLDPRRRPFRVHPASCDAETSSAAAQPHRLGARRRRRRSSCSKTRPRPWRERTAS